MLETIALVTFLLADGAKVSTVAFPKSGDAFHFATDRCPGTVFSMTEAVHKMIADGKIEKPANVQRTDVKILCNRSTRA